MPLLLALLIPLTISAAPSEGVTGAPTSSPADAATQQPGTSPAPSAAVQPASPEPSATPSPDPGAAPPASPEAAAAPAAQSPATPPARRWYTLTDGRKLALGLDLGAFGGAGGLVYFRPWDWLRVNAGLSWNYIGFGMRGGVGLTPPVRWAVTPSFNLEFGHFFSGDVSRFADSSSTPAEKQLMKSANYDWLSGQLGVEFGSQRSFLFYLRGGLTFLWASLPGKDLEAVLREQDVETTPTNVSDLKFSALVPCFSLGFLIYIY